MLVNFKKFKTWQKNFLARRPHRTLKLTRRRDYVRSLDLPGYIAFTHYVNKTVWGNKRLLLSLAALYIVLFTVLVGIGSQETYTTLSDTLQDAGTSVVGGDFSQLGEAGTLFLTIATVGISETPSESQQIYIGLLGLLVWLTTVWLLRNKMAGHKVKLRDALYNAGSPIVSLFLVTLVLLIQMIPILLAVIAYSAAASSGLLNGGVEAMLFWIGASILGLISIFWATSTFFAMIIVTLPGVYPMKALRDAGDLVLGRRLRIVLRWLWMFLAVAVAWVIVLVPALLLDIWLRSTWPAYGSVPVIPLLLALLGTLSLVWFASYVYLLYRKVIDESATKQ
jgi:hypothetical protein